MYALSTTALERQQQFTLDANTDVLCRIVGLYAARGIHIAQMDYLTQLPGTSLLTITAEAEDDVLRILVAKAASLFGVIRAESAMTV